MKKGLNASLRIEYGNAENGWLEGDPFLLVWFLAGEMKSKKAHHIVEYNGG